MVVLEHLHKGQMKRIYSMPTKRKWLSTHFLARDGTQSHVSTRPIFSYQA